MSAVNRIVRLGMIASLLLWQWRRRLGTRFRLQNRPSDEMADNCSDRRRPQVPDGASTTRPKQPTRQTILYVPLPGFWLSGRGLYCRWLLQSVAICCRFRLAAKTVADCYKRFQSVAIRENLADWASRCVPPIALVDEG